MKSARYRLRPLAPWRTPWQADSLFGAVCWEIARTAGEAALTKLLQRFRQGTPPFILSDGFPAELMPRPLYVLLAPDSPDARLITREQFVSLRHGQQPDGELPRQEGWAFTPSMHAAVPRDGGEPVVFETEECYWLPDVPEEQRYISLYVRAEEEWLYKLVPVLRSLGRSGFGARSTLGRGAFELLAGPEPVEWLEPLPFENAFVTLSHFVPEESDPADGVWNALVKYPRLGSERGNSSTPWKGRLVMLGPGSCFRPAGRPRRWYGRMIPGLSPAFPDAIHYGLAYAIGIRWEQP